MNETEEIMANEVETIETVENTSVTEQTETPVEEQKQTDPVAEGIDKFLKGFSTDADPAPMEKTQEALTVAAEDTPDAVEQETQQELQENEKPAQDGLNAPESGAQAEEQNGAENTAQSRTENTAQNGTENTTQNGAQPVKMPRAVTEAEWTELVEAHPDVVGQKLPDEIFKACVMSEKSPLQVYDSMMLKQTQSQMAFLNAENARLKKELENFHRAPVVPSEGSAVKTEPKDPILEGFLRYQ